MKFKKKTAYRKISADALTVARAYSQPLKGSKTEAVDESKSKPNIPIINPLPPEMKGQEQQVKIPK